MPLMMKKILATAFVLGLAVVTQAGDADAQGVPTVTTAGPALTAQPAIAKFIVTRITGEITVPAQFSSEGYGSAASLNGFNCSNLVITAESTELVPVPPGQFGYQHVWTRSVHATGNWASGKCSYSLIVRPDSDFALVAGSSGEWACDYISMPLAGTPNKQKVAKGTTKTDNMTLTKVACGRIG